MLPDENPGMRNLTRPAVSFMTLKQVRIRENPTSPAYKGACNLSLN